MFEDEDISIGVSTAIVKSVKIKAHSLTSRLPINEIHGLRSGCFIEGHGCRKKGKKTSIHVTSRKAQ